MQRARSNFTNWCSSRSLGYTSRRRSFHCDRVVKAVYTPQIAWPTPNWSLSVRPEHQSRNDNAEVEPIVVVSFCLAIKTWRVKVQSFKSFKIDIYWALLNEAKSNLFPHFSLGTQSAEILTLWNQNADSGIFPVGVPLAISHSHRKLFPYIPISHSVALCISNAQMHLASTAYNLTFVRLSLSTENKRECWKLMDVLTFRYIIW